MTYLGRDGGAGEDVLRACGNSRREPVNHKLATPFWACILFRMLLFYDVLRILCSVYRVEDEVEFG